jgi:2-polyprenyl-3-methyl-5-hydroxy-6-metoxy-1,4-benzoquinol methylase
MPSTSERGSSLFDETAGEFARGTDSLIQQQRYKRGDLIVAAAVRHAVPGGFVLDYGCGPGRIACLLGDRGFRVRAVDPSPVMIHEATAFRGSRGRVDFATLGDPAQELGPRTYDAIVCSSVIEYVAEPAKLLQSFNSALRDSGILIISFANRLSLWRAYAELRFRGSAPHFALQKSIQRWADFQKLLVGTGFRTLDGPIFFESVFDKYKKFSWLSGSRWIGTLGLAVAKK